MSDATTPANPTGQIATVAAVLSPEPPIVPASGTKRVPDDSEAAVVQDAQRWRNDLQRVYEGDFGSESKSFKRLAAHIERLEAERDAAERDVATFQRVLGNTVKAERLRELFREYSNGELVARSDLEAELATIAREAEARALKAEAMCERLAMLWQTSGGSDSCGRCPACPCVPDEGKPLQQGASCHASILAAAREAVRQGER